MKPVYEFTACELIEAQKSGALSARDIIRASLDRIEKLDPAIKALLSVRADEALACAQSIDDRRAKGEPLGSLPGLPVVLKDNICTKGWETTCASKILKNFKPPYDATVVTKLLAADAVVLAKANMDEFAFGSSTENSAFFPTRNPWDASRVPGGSSGGSVAAVASGMTPLALGSETGGSVRQPASFCGITGLKPTYGRVSRYGLIAFGSSLDQIAPCARDAKDVALLLGVLSGHDASDSTSSPAAVGDYLAELAAECPKMRIGLPKEYFIEGLAPDVEKRVREAAETLRALGHEVREVSLPDPKYGVSAYYIIGTAEASSNLARFDGVHYGHRTAAKTDIVGLYSRTREEGFGDEAKRRIMLGTYALSSGYYDAYYLKAAKVRRLVAEGFRKAFEEVDVVLSPTSPTTAFKLGERSSNPLEMYLADIFTIPANMAGIPGISIPCGFDASGLPVGVQLMAPALEETRLLRLANAFQGATDFHLRKPPI